MSTSKKRPLFLLAAVVLLTVSASCKTCSMQPRTRLAELVDVVPDLVLDIRYATTNNFTGQVVYPSARCFLVEEAACALRGVQEELEQQGYRLKVFDGYRPLAVQWIFWEILPDPAFVADPRAGSKHNRGYAVDLTLIDLDGNDVAMPTEFDDFTERAGQDYMDLPAEALEHRAILRAAMEHAGFAIFPTEWWHYDYQGWEDQPILDIPFDEIPEIETVCAR
jgi:D-alanyl-D-alanine dipeptidase